MNKKIVTYWFLFLAVLLAFSIVLTSCKSKKVKPEYSQKDSISHSVEIIKTAAINDTVFISVPILVTNNKNCDSICNKKFQEYLATINIKSDNGVKSGLFYNTKTKTLIKYVNAPAQESKKENNTIIKTKTIKTPVEKPQSKWHKFFLLTGYTFWIALLAVLGWNIFKIIKP